METFLRPLTPEDEPFLWQMLYEAIHVADGQAAPPREIVYQPELARYVQEWGRDGDCGFLASAETGQPMGAVWLRLLRHEQKGYGYVDDATPELSLALLPSYRGQGIGAQLLTRLFASDCGHGSVCLSVSESNPAQRLYARFGFVVMGKSGDSLTMKRMA